MSYTPTEWATGDVITAEKLNNMESGIAGAESGSVFEIYKTGENTLNKTKDEILGAIDSGKSVCCIIESGGAQDSGIVKRLPLVSFRRQRIDGESPASGSAIDGLLVFAAIAPLDGTSARITFAEINLESTISIQFTNKIISYVT